MTETLDRLIAEAEAHGLRAIESELFFACYSSLLHDSQPPAASEVIRAANVGRKLSSMWADLEESARCQIPDTVDTPIGLAARVMYFTAELLENATFRSHWYREASIGYAQSGNLPGCAAAWSRYKSLADTPERSDWLIDAILGNSEGYPQSIRELTPACLLRPWQACDEELLRAAQDSLYELSCRPDTSEVFEKPLSYRVSALLPLLRALSLPGLLNEVGVDLPSWYWDRLASAKRMLLMPSQVSALRSWFRSQGNYVLCTPTSTGKTFVAEIAILNELSQRGGFAFLVTPYRAVARGIYETLVARTRGSNVVVVAAYGDENVSIGSEATVVVGTPERIDGILIANPTLLQRASVVVFDEVHLISQRLRGAFYESLISRVLLEQSLTGSPQRIFAISAVVENQTRLGEWLGTSTIVRSQWRPNPIVEAYWSSEDELYVHDQSSAADDREYKVYDKFADQMPPWPSKHVPQRGMENALRQPLGTRCSWYVRRWSRETNAPVLVICASRSQTREFAQISASDLLPTGIEEVERVATEIEVACPYLTLLTHCIRRGIAYHNAAIPSRVRHQIENLLNQKYLKAVYATTTLAEGADFPFRAVVIASPAHFDPDSESYAAMSPLLLRNIAGRGGRTSGQLLGDVVQMYSPHTMEDAEGDRISSETVFERYLLDPAACNITSSLASGIGEASSPRQERLKASLFSGFDRVIYRWPNVDNAISQYRDMFFDPALGADTGGRLENTYESMMQNGEAFGKPLALRASPLRLTSLGEAVLRSGFSVASAGVIWQAMEDLGWFDAQPNMVEIVKQCAQLGGRIPEVTELRASNRRPLKDDNLGDVFQCLADGGSLSDAYLLAESDASAATLKRAERLVEGTAPDSDTVHARFEVFADELKRKLLIEVPSVANAMRVFADYRGSDNLTDPYEEVIDLARALRDVID